MIAFLVGLGAGLLAAELRRRRRGLHITPNFYVRDDGYRWVKGSLASNP